MDPIVTVTNLHKTYPGGHRALCGVDLEIRRGEIFALLGPNGAGKTTLIGVVCGLVRHTAGTVVVDGHDIARDWRRARDRIGLVPQELSTDMFERVRDTVAFSRGLFGRAPDPAKVESILRELSLWEKRDARIATLSGGMKRRVLIAKALAHEPAILFLDEPTAGVDVELRRDMWAMVSRLRDAGTTVILTTHYIEEAEAMADRIGVIDGGRIVRVQDKAAMVRELGRTRIEIGLAAPLPAVPEGLGEGVALSGDGRTLTCTVAGDEAERGAAGAVLARLVGRGIEIRTVETRRSSLEDIFVELVGHHGGDAA